MKALQIIALASIGALCFVGPMPAQARGGGGHNANSGSHGPSQNQPAVSSAKAKKGKVNIKSLTINKKLDKSSPNLMQ